MLVDALGEVTGDADIERAVRWLAMM